MLQVRNCFVRKENVDIFRREAKLPQQLIVVLAQFRAALCRDFGDTVQLDWTADRGRHLASRALERDDNIVLPELRIFHDLARMVNDAECKVRLFEDFLPVRHRL